MQKNYVGVDGLKWALSFQHEQSSGFEMIQIFEEVSAKSICNGFFFFFNSKSLL